MSEATSTISLLPLASALPSHPRAPARAPGSVGVLHPSLTARIVTSDGSLARPGEVGELHVRGGSVALGYWKDKAATEQAWLEGGWLSTGDLFWADGNANILCVVTSCSWAHALSEHAALLTAQRTRSKFSARRLLHVSSKTCCCPIHRDI